MTQKRITRSEFARRAGVSRNSVSKAARGKLKPAMKGDRLDPEHPAAVEYLERHTNGAERHKSPQPASNGEEAPQQTTLVPAVIHDESNLGAYADMTIREVVRRFGTERAFKDWLEAHKKIEDVEEKRIKNMELRGELVRRDFVVHTVFSAWEDSNRRLLSDVPRTVTARLYAAALSGIAKEESEEVVKDLISEALVAVKEAATRNL